MKQVKYLVKSDAIREIQEEIAKTRASWKRIEMLKPVYISTKYYELIKSAKTKKKNP